MKKESKSSFFFEVWLDLKPRFSINGVDFPGANSSRWVQRPSRRDVVLAGKLWVNRCAATELWLGLNGLLCFGVEECGSRFSADFSCENALVRVFRR